MYFAALPICFLVATGWKKPHPKRSNYFTIASMSQSAFDKINKDIIDAKKATDRLLGERRLHMQELVKDRTPSESFDMRLQQLLLEYPKWDTYGRSDGAAVKDKYTIYIKDCEEEKALDLLKDPRYRISSTIDFWEVFGPDLGGTYKYIATVMLYLEVPDDDDDYDEEEEE